MSFKYINPGYSKLLYINSSYASSIKDVDGTGKSRTGVAFINGNLNNCIHINGSQDEIWLKADCYINSTACFLYVGENNNNSVHNGIYINCSKGSNTYRVDYKMSNSYTSLYFSSSLIRFNSLNSFWLHMKYGEKGIGFVEFKINQTYVDKKQDYAVKRYVQSYIGLGVSASSDASKNLFSSIIISDEEISPYERIVPLSVSNTVTDMNLVSDTYVADTADETLLQSVNINPLVAEYGSESKVTGIALIGNPAYEENDVVVSLTSLTKKDNETTEHDTITLSVDTDAMIMSSFSLSTDTTVADLANFQFGWKSGA